jgi:hypothetical protein
MRHVLINHALAKKTTKRGGDATRVSFHSLDGTREYDHLEIMAIHEALERLEELDPRRATVVEAKVFGGLTNEEVAEVLGVSMTTVESEWRTGSPSTPSRAVEPPGPRLAAAAVARVGCGAAVMADPAGRVAGGAGDRA